MGKNYIIRIYKQEMNSVLGVIEDIEQNKRFGFCSSDELWALVTASDPEQTVANLIKLDTLEALDENSAGMLSLTK